MSLVLKYIILYGYKILNHENWRSPELNVYTVNSLKDGLLWDGSLSESERFYSPCESIGVE